MKLKNSFVFASLGLILMLSCSQAEQKTESCTPKIRRSEDANPNGSSELALLMRSVLEETEQLKLAIEKGELDFDTAYVTKIKKFHSAIPTRENMKPASFDGFATGLTLSAEKLVNSTEEDAKKNFNNMINSCVACHEVACPGPLVKIKKLPIL